jgi:hypothetical protein
MEKLNMNITDYINKLNTTIINNTEDFYEIEDLCEELENRQDKNMAIQALFTFIENNDGKDLGSPGPIVKLLEQFNEIYKIKLYESIQRKTTFYNLWMLNRYLNSINNGPEKENGMKILKSVENNDNLSDYIRERAKEFLQFHNNS